MVRLNFINNTPKSQTCTLLGPEYLPRYVFKEDIGHSFYMVVKKRLTNCILFISTIHMQLESVFLSQKNDICTRKFLIFCTV
jgi:hypothetical protein